MEYKLEITNELEKLAEQDQLNDRLAVLNLPAIYVCEKQCRGCYFSKHEPDPRKKLSINQIFDTIDYFNKNHEIIFITINGRGDSFHPTIVSETLQKIRYANSLGIGSYVFTAGDNLDSSNCKALAKNKANVMISLLGNQFVDAEFFDGKEVKEKQGVVANNLRRLMRTYKKLVQQPEEGITRLGMNYVISEKDLSETDRLVALKQAANKHQIYFHCNTNFSLHPDKGIQKALEQLADEFSNFRMRHSLAVDGPCRMGAASTVTVDYDGTLYQCPYMTSGDLGKFFERLTDGTLEEVLKEFAKNKGFVCVLRDSKEKS